MAALASGEHKCIVVGEDLGTVPENFRETLADWGIWSYQVMLFERAGSGDFLPPENYRENALVTFATHDFRPSPAGGISMIWRSNGRSAWIPAKPATQRHGALDALRRALNQQRPPNRPTLRRWRDTSRILHRGLLVISIEDVLGLREQINLPGTINEHPNWRRRLPVTWRT